VDVNARRLLAPLLALLAGCSAPAAAPERSPSAAHDPAPHVGAVPDFSGLWSTDYGTMRLQQHGAHVAGTYSYSEGSRIEGSVADGLLRASYVEPDGVAGRAIFEMSADGAAFRGRWRPEPDRPIELSDADTQRWDGSRVLPVPGRTWLVILEAPWEASLADPEYSYGAMLRSFFTRLPDVEVRHKLFHDRADFVRALREVGQLAGPVVLYVSSHGTPEGLVAGPDVIDGATIGSALRDAGDLRLLHFGACGMMRGNIAADIRAMAAPHAPFPISGFRRDVDWAASALVDLTYMDLVLEQELEPVQAVARTVEMLDFAGDVDGALPGTELVIVAP
jgi:hypothetical protein